jgi:Transglutaminase-like superfamily
VGLRLKLSSARAAWWAWRALRQTKRDLGRDGLARVLVKPPPRLPEGATRGVLAVVKRVPNTCLERALVLQTWLAAYGQAPDVVIGVAGPDDQFEAHAWLEGEVVSARYRELTRVPANVVR